MNEKSISLAVILGDGVGHDVLPVATEVIQAAAGAVGVAVEPQVYDYGALHYLQHGTPLPDDVEGLVRGLADRHDAILFGSAGLDPRIPKDVNCRDLLRALRFELDLYVNLRPAPLLHPDFCPLKKDAPIDLVVVRENTEGLNVRVGGNFKKGTPDEVAIQEDINTYKGVSRICRYAFEYAQKHGYPKVTMADKHGSLIHAHGLWQRVFWAVSEEFPDVEGEHYFIDTLCQDLLYKPEDFGVIVTNNMFGDILSDLCAGLRGRRGAGGFGVHSSRPRVHVRARARHGARHRAQGNREPLRGMPHGKNPAEHPGDGGCGEPDLGGDSLRRPREKDHGRPGRLAEYP